MKYPFRTAAAVLLTTAACTLAVGCSGSSDETSSDGTVPTATRDADAGDAQGGSNNGAKQTGSAPSTKAEPAPAKPTVAELNDRLTRAFDPAVPNAEKISWIQNAEQDPYLVQNLVAAAERENVTVNVTNVQEPAGGKVKADADVTIGGTPVQNAFIEFVAEGGQWKVSNTFACNVVKSAGIESAACEG
ncbi:hypothetical protein [Nocardia harenae]|uniref:hypothetical protein n=1 Tax=Nocardia harenae TaxID=358707 RepID=UPI00082E412E|nr:hypothetical protein [Nocardia harenae]